MFCNRDPSFLISFQNPTPNPSLTSRVRHPPSSSPNFLLITCFQIVSPSVAKRQFHLHKRALLRVERHLTPKPPFLLSKQTIAHFKNDKLLKKTYFILFRGHSELCSNETQLSRFVQLPIELLRCSMKATIKTWN